MPGSRKESVRGEPHSLDRLRHRMRALRGRRSRGLRLAAEASLAAPARLAGPARILGLDPGSIVTGYGVLDASGSGMRHVASGSIRAGRGELADRLRTIFQGVGELVAEYGPQEIAIERVFMKANPDSALKLGQARGAALCGVPGPGISVYEYAPREVKLAVTGTGAAEKRQVQHMVKALLGLGSQRLGADAADALAIAICHAHHRALGRAGGPG
jgi:crossover junction endodeoxyribonuclease RuvC